MVENTNRPGHNLVIKVHKISPLNIPELGICVYDTVEHFGESSKYRKMVWMPLTWLDRVVKKERAQGFEFPAQVPHELPESFYVCPKGDP